MKCFELRMLYSSCETFGSALSEVLDERCLTYLTGGVDDLGSVVLALDLDHLTEGVLDGGVVALDEVAIDELDGQGALACEDELVVCSRA